MECEEGIRSRKLKALKPIQTKLDNHEDDYDHDGEEEPLSPPGRLFHEPNFSGHIIAIMGCKTKIIPDVVKAKLPQTLLKQPRFSSFLVLDKKDGGEGKWVRTKVDLEKHIIVPDVDYKTMMMNYSSSDRFLEDYIYNLTKSNLDKSRPLWELHLLNVKTSEAESVCIFKIHHSLGDGISLMSLLLACTRQVSNPEALPMLPTAAKKKKDLSESGRVHVRWLWRSLLGFWWLLELLGNTFVDAFMFIATALFLKDTDTPIKGPPGTEYKPRRIVFKIVSLDDMKFIKNAMNATINDVAVGVTQAGLSKYLNRRYDLDHDNKNIDGRETIEKNNLPKQIRLRSLLFINIRPSPGIQALADMMEKNTKAKWGNSFGCVVLPFTIALMDDPLDYINQAKANVDRKKHSLEALCTFSIIGLIFNFFGVKTASGLFQRLFLNTTMAFSNVVGPIEEIGFYGHPMAFLAASTYGQSNGLMINFQSYVNKMTIVVSVDEDTIPDPHQLLEDIAESLKLIKNRIIEKDVAKTSYN
ncbi:hypothetical protein UlMin_040602 [Ulmus minor]